jgi:hypothetical protein
MPSGRVPLAPNRIRFSKWDGRTHWWCDDIVTLGADEHGTWLGWHPGAHWERPAHGSTAGMAFDAVGEQVMLLPHDRWFTATFYQPVAHLVLRTYVDITTVPQVVDGVWSVIDLDLDVCQWFGGGIYIDDEDEFEEHRLEFGYPEDVVAAARAECGRVFTELDDGAALFAESLVESWRSRLRELR